MGDVISELNQCKLKGFYNATSRAAKAIHRLYLNSNKSSIYVCDSVLNNFVDELKETIFMHTIEGGPTVFVSSNEIFFNKFTETSANLIAVFL